jgi:hypothetical protein
LKIISLLIWQRYKFEWASLGSDAVLARYLSRRTPCLYFINGDST